MREDSDEGRIMSSTVGSEYDKGSFDVVRT